MVCMWGKAHPCPCELSWVQPVLRSWLPVVSELSPATGREKSKTRWKEERSKCRRAEKEETEGERGRRGRLLAWQSLLLKHKLHTAQTCVCHMAVIPPPRVHMQCGKKTKQTGCTHRDTHTNTHTTSQTTTSKSAGQDKPWFCPYCMGLCQISTDTFSFYL